MYVKLPHYPYGVGYHYWVPFLGELRAESQQRGVFTVLRTLWISCGASYFTGNTKMKPLTV